MILLTAANGRTGRAVLTALVRREAPVRAFVRGHDQAEGLMAAGAAEVVVGDLSDDTAVDRAAEGCTRIVHIGPPMHPDEVAITDRVLAASRRTGAERFVYYSVMHPFRREVRHHALKLEATEHVVESDLAYTVLEPCRYMQHLEPIWSRVVGEGIHAMPFSTEARFSVVDLFDLAEVVARVATEDDHAYATYELAGPEPLSQTDMARTLTEVLGRPVRAEQVPLDEMAAAARARGMSEDRIEQMRIMNAHYDRHGFEGNPHVLESLLDRPATTYGEYVRRWAERSTVGHDPAAQARGRPRQ
jgi:uncharacterized protein YbjT (DUF2867 family)